MALRSFLKKTYYPLTRSGALLAASSPAAAAAAAAAPAVRPISDGARTLNNVYRGGLHLHPTLAMPNNIGLCATRYLSTCPDAAAAKIRYPRSGMPSINGNHLKSVLVDYSRVSVRTSSTRATIIDIKPSLAPEIAASGASNRRFLRNVRLFACGLTMVWSFTLYSAWSNPHRRRSCNGRCGHSKCSKRK